MESYKYEMPPTKDGLFYLSRNLLPRGGFVYWSKTLFAIETNEVEPRKLGRRFGIHVSATLYAPTAVGDTEGESRCNSSHTELF